MPAIHLRFFLACASLALAGCTPLLPRASSVVASSFDSYEAARQALEKVIPYQTRFEELRALGFDPQASANVTVIPYPEVVTRLAPHPGVPLEQLEPGVRDCILAQTLCRAYVFRYGQQRRVREGGFWSDFFNFDRTVSVTGWRFEGLVVVRNGVVLLRSIGGEPRTDRVDRQHNPLGPLQPAGEAAGSWLLR